MITLDLALDRLLHKRAYRQAFLDDDQHALDLSDDDRRALATIDRRQLVLAAERVASETLSRKHRGCGSLLDLFPQTIAAWHRSHEAEQAPGPRLPSQRSERALSFAFLDSEAFDGYREHPYAGLGLSLEEAFYRFCEAENVGEPIVREREMLAAIIRALSITPTAEMRWPDGLRRTPDGQGVFAVSSRGTPMLFAAVGGRFVTGEITPFLADLLSSTGPPEIIAARHGVGAPVLAASEETLRSLGLR